MNVLLMDALLLLPSSKPKPLYPSKSAMIKTVLVSAQQTIAPKINTRCSVPTQSVCRSLSLAFICLLITSCLFQVATSAQLDKPTQKDALVVQDYMVNLNQSIGSSRTTAAASTSGERDASSGGTIPLSEGDSHNKLPKAAAIEEENDDINNTTLIIDYDQRAYNQQAPTTTRPVAPSKIEIAPATATTTTAAVAAKPLIEGEKHDEDELGKSITTFEIESADKVKETIGGQDDHESAKLIDGERGDASETITIANRNQGEESSQYQDERQQYGSMRSRVDAVRDMRNTRPDGLMITNETDIYQILLKKKPYSHLWTPEQKWDDIFKRFMAIKDSAKSILTKNLLKDIEYYADVSISEPCRNDLKFVQAYQKKSSNFRWLMHMLDATGKSEAGMLTGNMAALGHVIQCIKARAPATFSNDSFDEQYFEKQTKKLGERFRGKYCLTSIRPVLPEKPTLISRFTKIMEDALLSNISYMGEPPLVIKQRLTQLSVPNSAHESIDRERYRLDQIPFESELYEYMIRQRNFMFSLPRFMGVCYPSSCSSQDIQMSLQKSMDDQHQVVDVEFECEQEEMSAWSWFTTPRLIVYVFLVLIATISFTAALTRYILVDKRGLKKEKLPPGSGLVSLLEFLDIMSMDKCAGVLFVKTKRASPIVDWSKIENNRSTSIDALKGFLILAVVYSELVLLGCLPVPFMWAKWTDAMFPFYRSLITQVFLNISVWSGAFYMISAYLIGVKLLEDHRVDLDTRQPKREPLFSIYLMKRYVRLVLPMVAFITLNYVWPRLSNGFVLADQSSKLLAPCDNYGWTNMLLFHNHNSMNETCLWPSHVSATFFQLHLISYPILLALLFSLRAQVNKSGSRRMLHKTWSALGWALIGVMSLIGLVYPAYSASNQGLIVPFLIDYIDFDNYRKVIEWTVMPTHNHLTSYMFGLALAYLVVKRRVDEETMRAGSNDSFQEASYLHKESSFESVMSSSTQELHFRQTFKTTNASSHSNNNNKLNRLAGSLSSTDQQSPSTSGERPSAVGSTRPPFSWALRMLTSGLVILVGLLALVASWLWNGQGQPMDDGQTFWYMFGTKLVFNLAFAYLFYKHFATRRNSSNPWMITRFLVPIGRMSLTMFYMGWLVVWFDLLTSLYQWHPSHYFVCEKFNEIIAMTLILSLFVYGSFEGTVKILQYRQRAQRLMPRHGFGQQARPRRGAGAQGFDNYFIADDAEVQEQLQQLESESSFGKLTTSGCEHNGQQQQQQQGSTTVKLSTDNRMTGRSQAVVGVHSTTTPTAAASTDRQVEGGFSAPSRFDSRSKSYVTTSSTADEKHKDVSRLSIADQYKLNAELRANYSFASIGLYESAGASADLTHSAGDPQMSPASSASGRNC